MTGAERRLLLMTAKIVRRLVDAVTSGRAFDTLARFNRKFYDELDKAISDVEREDP